MKIILIVFIMLWTLSNQLIAQEGCIFGGCPKPPTEEELRISEEAFHKARAYIDEAFRAKTLVFIDGYEDIPDYLEKTKDLKARVDILKVQIENIESAGEIENALFQMSACLAAYSETNDLCSNALVGLKEYWWRTSFSDEL